MAVPSEIKQNNRLIVLYLENRNSISQLYTHSDKNKQHIAFKITIFFRTLLYIFIFLNVNNVTLLYDFFGLSY